jgi:hypothetical protein
MLVKINSYDLMKKAYENFQAEMAAWVAEVEEVSMDRDRKMQAANEEVAAAQAALDELLDKAITQENAAPENPEKS